MPITAGSISIARRINTGDYSHKEAKIELHYVAEGTEDIKALGAQAAHSAFVQLEKVLATRIDHTPEIHVPAPDAAPAREVPAPDVAPAREVPAPDEPPKRHRRTKAEMGMQVSSETPKVESSLPDDPVNFAGAEITDKELNNLCNETMLRIKNKVNIQAVIGEYTQGAVSTIPQSARSAFMQKLQALQP